MFLPVDSECNRNKVNDTKFRWLRSKKGLLFCLLAVWQPLQSHGERFPLPASLEKCPWHGPSGSLCPQSPTTQRCWSLCGEWPLHRWAAHTWKEITAIPKISQRLWGGAAPTQVPGGFTLPVSPGHPSACPALAAVVSLPGNSGSFTAILTCSVYQLWLFKAIRDLHQESLNIEVILCKLLPLLQQEGREKPFFF